MATPADRDAALYAILDVQIRTLQALTIDVDAGTSMAREGRDVTLALTRVLTEMRDERRMTLWNVFIRALDRASTTSPVQTMAIVAPTGTIIAMGTLGALYSLVWHEPPAQVLRELLQLLPFLRGA